MAGTDGLGGGGYLSSPATDYAGGKVSAGTLALASGNSLTNTPVISIAGGATYDVSAADAATVGAGTLGSGQTLEASGSTSGGTLATAASHGLTLGVSSPLKFTAFTAGYTPLTLSGAGTLILGTNTPVTVTVASDSVVITRLDVGTGMPYIDITSTNTDANAGDPLLLVGTNNLQVVGTMWISNAYTSSVTNFPTSLSWTSAPITIVEGTTNTIWVFGTNMFGTITNDTVMVYGIPEGIGLGFIALAAALIGRKKHARPSTKRGD